MNLHGYICDDKWELAGNCRFTFGKKDGKEYFIKEFIDVKYPTESDNTTLHKMKLDSYNSWLEHHTRLIKELSTVAKSGNGTIIRPLEIFINPKTNSPCETFYKVNVLTNSIEEIGNYSIDNKISLLLTVSFALKTIHSTNIIHNDLKPDNILISLSSLKVPVCKVIDYDDSFFKDNIPLPEEIVGTESYWSPELAIYKLRQDPSLAKCMSYKGDVFALGIIFSQYLTGKSYPDLIEDKCAYQLAFENPEQSLGELFEKKLPTNFSSEKKYHQLFQIISKMLSLEPDNRPSMNEVHREIFKIKNDLNYNITKIPLSSTPPTTTELPNPKFFSGVNIDNINDKRIVSIEDMGMYCNVYYDIDGNISIKKYNKQTLKILGWVN